MHEIEKSIIEKLLLTIIGADYVVSVFDGEEYAIKYATEVSMILREMASTEMDTVFIHSHKGEDGKRRFIGTVTLVYGNEPWVVIADHTADDKTEALVAPATALANEYEAKSA